jgi:hypothetical protein
MTTSTLEIALEEMVSGPEVFCGDSLGVSVGGAAATKASLSGLTLAVSIPVVAVVGLAEFIGNELVSS